jgi:two-component system OmpR family sensor kinase
LLANLLDNAVKYSPKDAPVRIEALRSGAQVEIGVLDRGIGVEQADLERLFDPFFRTDRSRAKHSGGTGLGLALCKRIATALGGDIRAEAREGGGLALRLRLPKAPAPEGEQAQAQPG